MHGHAVVDEQGVQEGAEHAPFWGPCVKELHRAGFRHRVSSLTMNLEGTMVLKAVL